MPSPDQLRTLVRDRAAGRCEYYRMPEVAAYYAYEVDHVIAQKHGGQTTEGDLAYACFACNRHKGSDLCSLDPLTRDLAPLFKPRRDRWSDHFRLAGLHIQGLTATGRATARLLHFNEPGRLREREPLISARLLD